MKSTEKTAAPFLEVRGVRKVLGRDGCVALDDVSLRLAQGAFLSVLGPSGCGKTALLRVVAGLERQDAGSVVIDGQDVSTAPPAKRGCGIVFQSYALFPNMSALQNVAYGLRAMPSSRLRRGRAQEKLELVGLGDIAARYPAELSGGQQQRVALARALAPEPKLLLLDEPLSALDARIRVHLRHEIRRLQRSIGVTVASDNGAAPLQLDSDVQPLEMERLGLVPGSLVDIVLPVERLLIFSADNCRIACA